MALWKCLNPRCGGFDFEADDPVCPKCTVDGRVPKYANIIVRRSVIHFDPPDPLVPGMGLNHPLCDPSIHVTELHRKRKGAQASGHPDCVNCAQCRAHPDFPKDWTPEDAMHAVPQWTVGKQINPLVNK